MDILVCYDISTTTPEGRKRLRKVARVCQDFGQRVQNSVFECTVGEPQLITLRTRLLNEFKAQEDNLRIYRFHGKIPESVESYGIDKRFDFEDLILI